MVGNNVYSVLENGLVVGIVKWKYKIYTVVMEITLVGRLVRLQHSRRGGSVAGHTPS